MAKKTQLFISNPCHQRWGDMRPGTDGRFCGSCQKTVVDFTTMSDQEILTWFTGAHGPVCGRFMNDQLNRDLVPARMPKKRIWAVLWQFLLAGLLVSSEASAGEKPAGPPMGQMVKRADEGVTSSLEMVGQDGPLTDTGRITLQVVEAQSGQPVQWAVVRIGEKHFQADSAGRVSIDREELTGRRIEISAIGYETLTRRIKKKMLEGSEQIIRLTMKVATMGDVIIVGKLAKN